MEDVETVGLGGEANLEKVATLNPGLILGYDYHEDIYDELSQMAPTVALSGITEDWKEPFRKVAKVVGEQQRAERVIEEYFARLDNFKQEMGERLDRITVSFVTLREDHIRLYGEGSFPGELLQEAGLKMAPQPDTESELGKMTDDRIVDISRELIPQIKGDIIFFTLLRGEREPGRRLPARPTVAAAGGGARGPSLPGRPNRLVQQRSARRGAGSRRPVRTLGPRVRKGWARKGSEPANLLSPAKLQRGQRT